MKAINPKFDLLSNPEIWHSNEERNRKELASKRNLNPFPIEVFPLAIQEIITATNACLNFPIDFICASILYALSVSIGNTMRVEIKKGWTEGAVLYIILVGPPGTNKSHPLSFALKPLQDADKHTYREYNKAKKEYDQIKGMTLKEKRESGKSDQEDPMWIQNLVSDSTPEALAQVHKYNLRGIGVYHDEIASWTKNFNRYNNGSEEQFWLSNWSGKPITINRKISGNTFIPWPFIPVIGTIQPAVLKDFAPSNGIDNGFIDRILYALPDFLKKEYWSEAELDPSIIEKWRTIVSNTLRIGLKLDGNGDIEPRILKLDQNAKNLLFQWQRELTDRSNSSGIDAEKAIYSKMEMYAARFSLIIEMAKYACKGSSEDEPTSISFNSVEGAIKLVEYFINTALKVRDIITNDDPLERLTDDKKLLYSLLPDQFTTEEGVTISVEKKILQERAAKDFFIKNKDLFKRVKRGHYEKI